METLNKMNLRRKMNQDLNYNKIYYSKFKSIHIMQNH